MNFPDYSSYIASHTPNYTNYNNFGLPRQGGYGSITKPPSSFIGQTFPMGGTNPGMNGSPVHLGAGGPGTVSLGSGGSGGYNYVSNPFQNAAPNTQPSAPPRAWMGPSTPGMGGQMAMVNALRGMGR